MTIVSDEEAVKYYNNQPKKRIGAGVLIFNRHDELLIVKPNYLEKWLWVGGGVEEAESPKEAALRECKEEIGVAPSSLRLAFINYLPSQPSGQSDILQFLFIVDQVENDFIEKLHLQPTEIEDVRFVAVAELSKYLHDFRARAVQTYCKSKNRFNTVYMENGRLMS